MDPQPIVLTGRHVRLEPLSQAHAADLSAALRADPTIWRWLTTEPPLEAAQMTALIDGALADLAAGTAVPFAQIALAPGGGERAVGSTRYLNISRRDQGLEIGWTWLGRPWQRTGVNREAKLLLLRHAFEALGAVRVQLKTDARNEQSQRAIEGLGAVREGVLRKYQRTQGGFIRDSVMYSITADEWPAVRRRLEAQP